LRRGPTIQTKMSLANAGIYCISQPLSGAMEDCSIFQVQQLQVQMLYRRRCCMSAPQRLVVERSRRSGASATRRQSSARYDGEMLDSDRWTSIEPTAGAVLWDCFRTPHKTAPVTGEDTERNSIWRDLNSSNNLPPGGGVDFKTEWSISRHRPVANVPGRQHIHFACRGQLDVPRFGW